MYVTLQRAIIELRQGSCGGVFVDDTGFPGLAFSPKHLHPKRKSWVAVIVPRRHIAEVMEQFPKALAELYEMCGAQEFHSVDIYQGKKQFKGIPFGLRMGFMRFMAHIFQVYGFPIFVQTFDPAKKAVNYFAERFPDPIGPFDLKNHEDLALFVLFLRVKSFLGEEMGGEAFRLFLDQGRFKKNSTVTIPGLDPPFIKGEIISEESSTVHPIQLADFAAFGLNRTQLLLGQNKLNDRDAELLTVLSPIAENFRNIHVGRTSLDQWPPLDESDLHKLLHAFEEEQLETKDI